MEQGSGLVRRRHRRGKKRRNKLRLGLRVAASLVILALAAALSAGMVHIVERPMPPFEALADQLPKVYDPTMPQKAQEAHEVEEPMDADFSR